MDNPFFHSSVAPIEQPNDPHAYVGIGCVGSDGKTGEFGFALVLLLWFAEKVRQSLSFPPGTILLNDLIGGQRIEATQKEKLLNKLLELLQVPWRVVRVSALLESSYWNQPYEQIETASTLTLLPHGGYQIGWAYPYNTLGARDERYFSEHLLKSTGRKNIGFVFGEFPVLLPTGLQGPPYLVKPAQASRRVLLLEENTRQKFVLPNGELPRLRPGKTLVVLRVLEDMGLIKSGYEKAPRFFKDNRHVALLIEGIDRLSNLLRHLPDLEV